MAGYLRMFVDTLRVMISHVVLSVLKAGYWFSWPGMRLCSMYSS